VIVPEFAPTLIVVAAPNRFPVKALVLNTLTVPVDVVVIDGEAPFRFNDVALVPVIVGLPIVTVPVAAPTPIVVAAPNALTVVAVVLIKLNVV
jgi:hypothetical protein